MEYDSGFMGNDPEFEELLYQQEEEYCVEQRVIEEYEQEQREQEIQELTEQQYDE